MQAKPEYISPAGRTLFTSICDSHKHLRENVFGPIAERKCLPDILEESLSGSDRCWHGLVDNVSRPLHGSLQITSRYLWIQGAHSGPGWGSRCPCGQMGLGAAVDEERKKRLAHLSSS